jgi:hypothetical protein
MSLGYSYSSESDYWAHLFSVGTSVDLFQKNTTLALSMSWGINEVARRAGPTVYVPIGGMATWTTIASWTQVLTQRLLLIAEYDLSVLGFGDRIGSITGLPNSDTGFLANPYRSVNLGGSPAPEQLPFQRIRQSVQLTFHWLISTGNRIVPYLVFRPSYRFYWDDWGILSHTPELRWYVPVGPVEFRLTGRYYNQNAAVFANTLEGRPGYPNSMGKPCGTCISDASRGFYYTADPKLYATDSFFVDVRLVISLRGLGRFKKLPAHDWLAGGFIELNYGHWFTTKVPQLAFGDADLAGIAFSFPL